MSLLEIKNLSIRFGGLVAVEDLSLSVDQGQIYSIIGPNGAGKTTVFNAISGVYCPSSGEIFFEGKNTIIPWRACNTRSAVLSALISALVFLLALNIQDLWANCVTTNYQYKQSFNWAQAYPACVSTFDQPTLATFYMPILLGFLLGLAGYIALWSRARATPDRVARHGLRRTFQNIRLFGDLTVEENLLLGLHSDFKAGILAVACRLPIFRQQLMAARCKVRDTLEFVGLKDRANQLAGSLSYGHQRRVEIARALIADPKLIMLDEPAAGMNPSESDELIQLIRKIRERGTTVLLIEHDMRLVMQISDYLTVLNYGKKIAQGNASEVRNNPLVIEAYLGKGVRG